MKKADRVLTLDGRWTDTEADCYAAAGYILPGTKTKVVITRDGKTMELTIKPALGI